MLDGQKKSSSSRSDEDQDDSDYTMGKKQLKKILTTNGRQLDANICSRPTFGETLGITKKTQPSKLMDFQGLSQESDDSKRPHFNGEFQEDD